MFAKLLANHPDIECLFQPYNNSIFRKKLFEYWDVNTINVEANLLVDNILKGNWTKDIIDTPWFHKHSSSFELQPNKSYVIKTTNLHLKYEWFRKNYPQIQLMSLIRNPLSIMASLSRNGFMGNWYGEKEFQENIDLAKKSPYLLPKGAYELGLRMVGDIQKTAFIIGVNNYVMLQDSKEGEVVKFEDILASLHTVCGKVTSALEVEEFDFSAFSDINYNVIGESFSNNSQWKEVYTNEDLKKMVDIFTFFGGLGY